MNRTGLGRFGVTASTVLRERTTDREGYLICPECGHPIGDSAVGQEVAHPEIVSDHEPATDDGSLVIHGWECDRHSGYSVVCPTPVGTQGAAYVVNDGWTDVRVRMADGFVRTVAVPERELRELADDASAEERGSA